MRTHSRQFYIYDLEITSRKKGATLPIMTDLLPIFEKMKHNERIYSIHDNTAKMLIGDIHTDPSQQTMTLLIRLSDQTAPNSVTSNPSAQIFNVHTKKTDQGADFGCHVLISTAQEKALPNTYTCAIERVSGITVDLVKCLLSKLLNYEFHENTEAFSYLHPAGGLTHNGSPRVERCCPHVELRGRPSETFINDINNGYITGISLIQTENQTPLADACFLKKKQYELKLQIDHNNIPANMWDVLRRVFKSQSMNYGAAKVSYKLPGKERSVTVEIDSSTGNLLDKMYVKSFDVTNIFPPLDCSTKQVVSHLQGQAMPKFLANRSI